MSEERFDAIVIGAGQAGGPLASALSEAGWNVALIERKHVGGSCINFGCTPTKTMIASAHVAHMARRAGDFGIAIEAVEVDMADIRQRKREIVHQFREGSLKSIEQHKRTHLIRGHAHFTAPKVVTVTLNDGGTRTLTAEHIFVNTGTRGVVPPIEGIDQVSTLDEGEAMELTTVPSHLIILGGGYVGVEFAQMFRRLGSQVTIIDQGEHLLSHEDADISEAIEALLKEDGIELLLNAKAASASRSPEWAVELSVEAANGAQTIVGSHLLLAAGRRPNTDDLGLDAAGIETDDKGHITVNERLETSQPGVYAMGDVKGGPAFTHISYDDFRIVSQNILHDANATTEDRILNYTVFIDPQLGRAGLTESQAREQGRAIKVATLPMSQVARAIETGETRGVMKAIVDADSGHVLGCAILGVEGGEIMSMIMIAMMGGLSYTALRDGVFSHPTLAESLNSLFTSIDS